MEVTLSGQDSAGPLTRGWQWLKALRNKFCAEVMEIVMMTKKIGQDDPRRIIHSLKVGLALTLVSLFYLFKPLYDGLGVNAMWAVLSVVVVFEFSCSCSSFTGATLGKGLNRMLATFVAGALGVAAHCLATLSGRKGEPILIATFVFIIAAIVTFMRFFPRMKARYDYGLLIFILTFSLVSISGYREDQVLKVAYERVSNIIVGSCISVIICISICPVWIGGDLHNSVAANMERLGNFLEAFGDEYFKVSEEPQSNENKSFLLGYRSVLTSKSGEETMANLARWEPGHGRFAFRHPWKMYLKIGNLTRECAYKAEALNSYLNSKFQTPAEIRGKIQGPCKKVSLESSKALKELASTFRKMVRTRSAMLRIGPSRTAADELKTLLKTSLWEEADLLEIIPAASVASLLLEIIECVEKIAEAVYELAMGASFRSSDSTVSPQQPDLHHRGAVQQVSDNVISNHVITVGE
ncbi:aluminum-activated malate transporter 2-like [Durio zibethinus]|uniref:Aluminum-activated malate transporter 2-like n=1 Tax=Durio zibethinus TaxID=66656 RepID=A0A6P5XLF9_DURZI|nr:aluminum-activated malate transporter 2-like [Durio zibethinus]